MAERELLRSVNILGVQANGPMRYRLRTENIPSVEAAERLFQESETLHLEAKILLSYMRQMDFDPSGDPIAWYDSQDDRPSWFIYDYERAARLCDEDPVSIVWIEYDVATREEEAVFESTDN